VRDRVCGLMQALEGVWLLLCGVWCIRARASADRPLATFTHSHRVPVVLRFPHPNPPAASWRPYCNVAQPHAQASNSN
jgi:hypothetical protein